MNSKPRVLIVAVFTLAAGIFTSNLVRAAQDFSQYSHEELVKLRTQVSNMDAGDRARYQQELQLRLQKMNANERARLGLDGYGQEQQLRQRLNEDSTQGQGMLQRERQRVESDPGYGRGFGSRQGMSGGGRGR